MNLKEAKHLFVNANHVSLMFKIFISRIQRGKLENLNKKTKKLKNFKFPKKTKYRTEPTTILAIDSLSSDSTN